MFDSLVQALQHCRADRVTCTSKGSWNLAVETYTAHLGPERLVVSVSDITFFENSACCKCTCTKMSAGFLVLLPSCITVCHPLKVKCCLSCHLS